MATKEQTILVAEMALIDGLAAALDYVGEPFNGTAPTLTVNVQRAMVTAEHPFSVSLWQGLEELLLHIHVHQIMPPSDPPGQLSYEPPPKERWPWAMALTGKLEPETSRRIQERLLAYSLNVVIMEDAMGLSEIPNA